MKIAITGGTGLLGSYFVRRLLEDGVHTPVILTRKDTGGACNGVEARRTDYSVSSLVQVLNDIDAVVHLAAQRGISTNLMDYLPNVEITESLYKACGEIAIKNIVYASTISVYSNEALLPWDENIMPVPTSMYGISKLDCEYIGGIYSERYGLRIKNLRLAHLYGCNEQNNYMINVFMRQAFKKETLKLFSEDCARREFLYAKDASHALLCAVESESEYGTFNIGSEEFLTNREVAETINEAFGNRNNLSVEIKEDKPLKASYMKSGKAAKMLGFKARYSFLEAMIDIYGEMADV